MKPAAIQARTAWVPVGDGLERELVVTLPLRTVSEANTRCHWAVRANRAKTQRLCAALSVRRYVQAEARRICGDPLRIRVLLPVVVTLTRRSPRALDDDNLRSALKAVRDGVADALGVDDRDPRVTWEYDQVRGSYGVDVRIVRTPRG